MSDLDRRKEGMDAKLKVESELRFKVEMHRDKALGRWAAEKLGLSGADADAYVKSVVHSDFEESGSEDVVRKIAADFSAKNVDISADEIRTELARCEGAARQELMN